MKAINKYALAFMIFLSFYQQPVLDTIIKRYNTFAQMYKIQKIFVHTDKNNYQTGEHIWFKLYVLSHEKLDTNARMAYVELIGPDQKIKQVRIIKLKNAQGFGDFYLNDSLYSGFYLIRAYTNLMKNFPEDFFFKKMLYIHNPKPEFNQIPEQTYLILKSIQRKKNKIIAKVNMANTGLINARLNTIYIYVTNILHQPVVAQITLKQNNKTIKQTQTDSIGFAMLNFKPLTGKNYKLIIQSQNEKLKIKLPNVEDFGFYMQPLDTLGFIKVKIKRFQPPTNDKNKKTIYLIAERNGKIYFLTYKTVDDSTEIFISKHRLPAGIIHLTLIDGYGKVIMDQVAFVKPFKSKPTDIDFKLLDNNKLRISISTDKTVNGYFSISITTDSNLQHDISLPNYLSLRSDLPELPEILQIPQNLNPKINALKWTRYSSKFIWGQQPIPKPKYQKQESIQISGTVTKLFFDIPVPNNKVKMTILNAFNDEYVTYTDSHGRFTFSGLNYPDTIVALIESRSRRGTKNVLVNVKPYDTVKINFNPILPSTAKIKWSQLQNKPLKKWIKDRNALHSHVDQVIYMDKYPVKGNQSVLEFLRYKVPGYYLEDGNVYFRSQNPIQTNSQPLFLLNNVPVDIEAIKNLNIDDVERIEIIKNPSYTSIYGRRGWFGVIAIYTKKGHKVIRGRWTVRTPGFYTAKKFHLPPDSVFKQLKAPTIYWNPMLKISNGISQNITIQLPANIKTFKITIQGIDPKGNIIFAKKDFSIFK